MKIGRLRIQAEFAEECVTEWKRGYEELTRRYGAYGEVKLRAAYRGAARLAAIKLSDLLEALDRETRGLEQEDVASESQGT